jgi:pimeloyl-ACP methyl ester carboxylesterase
VARRAALPGHRRLPRGGGRVGASGSPALARREWGRGPAVLLVHGWCGVKEAWGPLPEALAEAGLRAVAVDLPGWGGSRGVPVPRHSPAAYAEALAPLTAALRPVGVVGHSMGAQTALLLARRDPAIRALALLAPPACRVDRLALPPRGLVDLVCLPGVGIPATRLALLALKVRRPPPALRYRRALADPRTLERPGAGALVDAVERAFRRTPTATMARSLRASARTDMRAPAAGLALPTLVVVGERDRVVHPAEAVSLAHALPAATLLSIAGCGHLPHLERPEVAVPAIVGHLVEAVSTSSPDRHLPIT